MCVTAALWFSYLESISKFLERYHNNNHGDWLFQKKDVVTNIILHYIESNNNIDIDKYNTAVSIIKSYNARIEHTPENENQIQRIKNFLDNA